MKRINSLPISQLRANAYLEFYMEFRALALRSGVDLLKIDALFATFVALFEDADTAYKKVMKSTLTQELYDLDKDRDNLFSGMVKANKAALQHYDEEVRKAAIKLKVLFDTYGDIAHIALNEETFAITNIVQDLEEKYPAETAKTGLNGWLNELKALNQNFRTLMRERFDETTERTDLKLREVRVKMDEVYRQIVERIHAAIIMEGELPVYVKFVDDLNTVIKKYADILSQQAGARAATKARAAEDAAAQTETKIDPEIEAFVKEAETPKK
jgi:hypothetical protein